MIHEKQTKWRTQFLENLSKDLLIDFSDIRGLSVRNLKYSEYKTSSELADINWGQNIHVIRFSDVLLMTAELNIGVNQAKADAYLSRVRKRAGMPDRTANIDNIRYERRVERL